MHYLCRNKASMPVVLLLWCFMFIAGTVQLHEQTEFEEQAGSISFASEYSVGTHDAATMPGQRYLFPQSDQLRPKTQLRNGDWAFWLFFACFLSLALARFLFADRIQQFLKAIFIYRVFSQVEREGYVFREVPVLLLLFNYSVVFALMVFLSIQQSNQSLLDNGWHPGLNTLAIFCVIMLLFFFKSLLVGFLSWVFNTRQASQLYMKNTLLFNKFTGLLLFPLIAFSLFLPSEGSLLVAWGIWSLMHLFRIFRGAIIAHASARFSVYYLILYLCGVELAPLLLIVKVAHNVMVA